MSAIRERLQDPDLVYRRRWLTLLVLCVSLVVIVLDNTILNVALPTLARPSAEGGLGASSSQLQWIVDSYTIVFAGLLLTAGSLGDRFGRYRFLAGGLIVFGLGSLLSAFAPSATTLIFTRALMGIGGAFIMPSTLSILTNVFTEPKERSKAIGIWAGVSALGLGIGPITGGVLLAHFSWGSIFLVNVPLVLAGLAFGFFLIPESRDPSAPKLDPVGAGLSIVGLTAVLWAVIEAPDNGWLSAPTLGVAALGLVVLGAFFVWELRSEHPMLNMEFFKNPRFSAASGAITLTFLALFGTIFLLTQYLQSVLDYSTIKAGAVLLPQAAVIMIAAPTSSLLVNRIGNKRVIVAGLTLVAISMVLFTTMDVGSSTIHVILISMLLGLGMGNVMAPATDSIMGALPRAKAGVGSAMNDTTRQVGGAVGVAVLGSILASRFTNHVTSTLSGKVPGQVLGAVSGSIGDAQGFVHSPRVSAPVQAQFAKPVLAAAKDGYVLGMHTAAVVAAVILAIAAVSVWLWLPHRATDPEAAYEEGVRRRAGGGGDETTDGAVGAEPDTAEPVAVGADSRSRDGSGNGASPSGAKPMPDQAPTGAGGSSPNGSHPAPAGARQIAPSDGAP